MTPELRGLLAPAKLNLFLHLTGRRADGYHLLQSVFVMIDWCDTIDLKLRADGSIVRQVLENPWRVAFEPDDLCTRAARVLQKATGTAWGVNISLHKRIPAQAGLGGGSSDAAAVLLGLRKLWQLNVSDAELQSIGLGLGADVPFFLSGQNAWVEGVGERVSPLPGRLLDPACEFCVVKPASGISTAEIFRSPHLNRNTEPAILASFAADPMRFGTNDLQAVACGINPEIQLALNWLKAQPQLVAQTARMSGSGSAVFAALINRDNPAQMLDCPDGWVVRQCGLLSAHPLAWLLAN